MKFFTVVADGPCQMQDSSTLFLCRRQVFLHEIQDLPLHRQDVVLFLRTIGICC